MTIVSYVLENNGRIPLSDFLNSIETNVEYLLKENNGGAVTITVSIQIHKPVGRTFTLSHSG